MTILLNSQLCSLRFQPSFSVLKARFSSHSRLNELLLKMPRDNTQTQILKKQRVKIKEKSSKYSPGIVNLQILGSGAKGAPRALYLFTDQSRYLFNCGEGSQRLAHEHKIKLSKLEHIFITYGSWKNIGGLPGVALTLQDVGVPQLVLHGPENIDSMFPATRRFVVLKNLSIKTASCTTKDVYEDNVITVKYIPLAATQNRRPVSATDSIVSDETNIEDEIDYYEHEKKSEMKRRSSSAEPGPKKLSEEDVVMCYAVKLQPKPGALCLEKCVEAGVPPGPLLGKLKAGEDVVLNDGTIVRSADVTLAHDPGPLFLVVEVPYEKFLPCLERSFSHFQSPEKEENHPFLIVHFTPPEIMCHPIYKKWMEGFRLTTQHLLVNEANTCLGSTAVHRVQYKLNLIEPSFFPLLKDSGFTQEYDKLKENIPNGNPETFDLSSEFCILKGNTTGKIWLRPRRPWDVIESLQIDPEGFKTEAKGVEGFSDEVSKFQMELAKFPPSVEEYPNIIFLGTGSCIPNKTRNTSAILLSMSDDCRIMLDCGEGTAGQVVRYFGPKEASKVFASLRAVYVSHLHADHHIGLIGILQNRPQDAPPLFLFAPSQIMTWLKLYEEYFENILQYFILVPNTDMFYTHYKLRMDYRESLKSELNMETIQTTYVRHCPNAFGVSLTSRDGWKLTYSGDTMPCDNLVELGMGSDVLIHEATMEDDLVHEARAKMHCTTSEAIEVGKKMNAKHIILTHFSQRYAKLPRIVGNDLGNNVGVAFDNMKVRFCDLPKLKLLYPSLKLIFHEEIEELEEKAFRRKLKEERAKAKRERMIQV
ncbi:ribonuclease Z, mitochondrial isoform X1 [Halyomorpha halys]|uniref:ribonuclease Z, mitochondrial isoform X1 n=1 Tax=Halyomorpha halys TaxID=286706 RepID=UPI0006D514E5|nr:ribonuclease Z, mitochondrial isoform X1 [Halyomorpha halys]